MHNIPREAFRQTMRLPWGVKSDDFTDKHGFKHRAAATAAPAVRIGALSLVGREDVRVRGGEGSEGGS